MYFAGVDEWGERLAQIDISGRELAAAGTVQMFDAVVGTGRPMALFLDDRPASKLGRALAYWKRRPELALSGGSYEAARVVGGSVLRVALLELSEPVAVERALCGRLAPENEPGLAILSREVDPGQLAQALVEDPARERTDLRTRMLVPWLLRAGPIGQLRVARLVDGPEGEPGITVFGERSDLGSIIGVLSSGSGDQG